MSKVRIAALEKENAFLREDLKRLKENPSDCPLLACGHSCVCARATGMATNGPCRCDERALRRAVLYWRNHAYHLRALLEGT